MSLHAVGDDDLDGIREALRELTGEGFDRCEPPEDAADLELLALRMIGPFADPEMPPDAAALLPRALSERGDALAAGILTCLERLAPASLATAAAKPRARLARKGIVSPFDDELGALVVEECSAVSLGGRAELLGALLQRPGSDEYQGALLVVENKPCGGVIVEGLLSGPEHPESLRDLLRRPSDEVSGEAIGKDELARRLLAALGHMVDHNVGLQVDILAPLLILERALGDGIGRWPQPSLEVRDTDDDEDEGDGAGGAYDDAEELIEAFEAALAPRSRPGLDHAALLSHAPFVARAPLPAQGPGLADAPLLVRTLLGWKLEHAVDERLEHWTSGELEEFLLVWYPRNGDSRPEAVERLPDFMEVFLRFLADSGRLSGEPTDVLVSTLARLRRPFEDAALDRSRWGIVKTLVMQMYAEGVDPDVAGAGDAWLEGFMARPWAERERVIGLALDEATSDAIRGYVDAAWEPRSAPARGATAGRRKARRRTAKAARRRNRR